MLCLSVGMFVLSLSSLESTIVGSWMASISFEALSVNYDCYDLCAADKSCDNFACMRWLINGVIATMRCSMLFITGSKLSTLDDCLLVVNREIHVV